MPTDSLPRHPRPKGVLSILSVCIAVGLVTLVLSVQNAIAVNHLNDKREGDRIAADLQACERGNVFRQQIIDLGTANDEMISTILDTVFENASENPERTAAIEALRRELDQPIEAYRSTVAAIVLTDCQKAVPGAEGQS